MRTVYFISGLGADRRMFQFLKLPGHLQSYHVEWIAPTHPNEPLPAYVRRLQAQVTHPNPILIGLSYGGLAAIELAKVIQPQQVILISSLSTRHALPWYYRFLGEIGFHRWAPIKVLRQAYPLAPSFFGARSPYTKKLLREIFMTIDEQYLRWALEQLLNWPQEDLLPNCTQVHGTADRVLPLHDKPHLVKVEGGEHLMVLHQADEISAILAKILNSDEQE